jgi:hypothetical protein
MSTIRCEGRGFVHTEIPTRADLELLLSVRDAACVSIYLPTSPEETGKRDRLEFQESGRVAHRPGHVELCSSGCANGGYVEPDVVQRQMYPSHDSGGERLASLGWQASQVRREDRGAHEGVDVLWMRGPWLEPASDCGEARRS